MTIFNPKTGKDRYRIGDDFEVADLDDPPCKHLPSPIDEHCLRCGRSKQQLENENV